MGSCTHLWEQIRETATAYILKCRHCGETKEVSK